MKRIRQFRYSGDNSTENSSSSITKDALVFGNIFQSYNTISQMGIQGRPGTSFYLNNSEFPIVLGETGIYEIDLQDRGTIHSIGFVDNSAFKYYTTFGDRLLIDIVYEG